MDRTRRHVLRFGGLAAAGALAGCTGGGGSATEDGGDGAAATDTATPGDTPTGTDTATEADGTTEGSAELAYGWQDATWDSYWYSLYNMSTNIAMSGNGVTFPNTEQQRSNFEQRLPAMLETAGEDGPPIANPNLNMLPFTTGDPRFTQQPVFEDDSGRPDADTLAWDRAASSGVVSPSSVAWTHLKGVTWAKNFEAHFDILPDSLAAEFRSMVLSTLAQVGTAASLVRGGPQGNGLLTANDENLQLLSGVRPAGPEVTDDQPRPHHHAAMLWFLADLNSLAQGGWYGYENPEPVIPAGNVQTLADGMAGTTMNAFAPGDVVSMESTRSLGLLLAAVGYYGTQAGSEEMASSAADYANALAAEVEANLAGNGMVENGAENLAATQGIVGQGLLWASQVSGVDHADTAADVLGYMLDELWDSDANTFASGPGDDVYAITARDAGDVTGGINAADALTDHDVREVYARYFDATMNRGRLQRAERPPSRSESAEHTLPLPPMAGGEYGQSAVYNAAVEYDTGAGEWSVTDDTFRTEWALYLANQDVWVGQWGGEFYQGRGVPGESDEPPAE